jgi:hypothetical protein
MKTRERLNRLKTSGSFEQSIMLSEDYFPGTKFDSHIYLMRQCLNALEKQRVEKSCFKKQIDVEYYTKKLTNYGVAFAKAVRDGNSQFFRDWADCVDRWRDHEPQRDALRSALIEFCWQKERTYTMRDIIQHLRGKDFIPKTIKESAGLDAIRRNVRRICGELGITVKGKSGRPKNKDTNAS